MMYKSVVRQRKNLSNETRNALLVVAGLILTATYQATLSPSGVFSQGPDDSSSTTSFGSNNDSANNDPLKGLTVDGHLLGKSVMDSDIFLIFYVLNTLSFFLTFVTLHFLISGPPLIMSLLSLPLVSLFFCCVFSAFVISPTYRYLIVLAVFAFITFPTRSWLSKRSRYANYLVKKYKYKNYQDGDYWGLY
ncbi:hypothetical protein DITRI_Ditri09bG0123500 [Diplodiscus trichospermus]